MKIKKQRYAVLSNGEKVALYTISNDFMSFSVTNYGCIITSIIVPSAPESERKGQKDDIVLGYSTLDGYIGDTGTYFGAFVGRFANRIANAKFTLNDKEYTLDANNGKHSLHGGFDGYNRMVWKAKEISTQEGIGVCFTRKSLDGEQGFPGTVKMKVSYILTKKNQIIMHYEAKTDADTPINLTNHSYYNLKGSGKGDITSHVMMINADKYLPVRDDLIPTGELASVINTPFDFNAPKEIGKDISKSGGYDHCYCLNKGKDKLHLCAEVREPSSRRVMTVHTDQIGVQFYSGNFLDIACGKNGLKYEKHTGFCLETQCYPDSPNQPNFPSCILKKGREYTSTTIHKFDVY